jgi:hypothetical protein
MAFRDSFCPFQQKVVQTLPFFLRTYSDELDRIFGGIHNYFAVIDIVNGIDLLFRAALTYNQGVIAMEIDMLADDFEYSSYYFLIPNILTPKNNMIARDSK